MARLPKYDDKGYLFIVNYFVRTGKQPSFQAIADELGYASKRSVQLLLERLHASGRINYSEGKIELPKISKRYLGERTVPVPLVGTASAGALTFAQQDIEEHVDVSTVLAKPGSKYFILRVKGDSMNRAGINNGDLVLVRQQATANNGDRVVALVGDEATIKYFYREKGLVMLKPDSTNPDIKPVVLSSDFMIQGVVITTLPDPF